MFEYLISNAGNPDAPALRTGSGRVHTYGKMGADICQCVSWLSKQRLEACSRVMLYALDPYLHWVLFFALEARGVVTAGVSLGERIDASFLNHLGTDIVFSSQPDPHLPGIKWMRVDGGLLTIIRSFRLQQLPIRRRLATDPICIVLSSGTTGVHKKVLLTRELLNNRSIHNRDAGFLTHGARLATLLPNASIGGIYAALQTWIVGGTIIFPGSNFSWAAELSSGRVNTIAGAPAHFERVLSEVPLDMPRPQGLHLVCGGGTLHSALRDRLRQSLTDRIIVSYGSTEAGIVTFAPPHVVGSADEVAGPIWSWTRVEVIGDGGVVLPHGETGELRISGDDVVSGYFESPEDTGRHFRDGWFYPGDLGYIDAQGNLVVTGRVDDLMNFGGAKTLPSGIEALVRNVPGIEDAAAFPVADEEGELRLCIAYCARAPVDEQMIKDAVRLFPRIQVVQILSIPRNPMGKIERLALRKQAEQGLLERVARKEAG